MGLAGNSLAQTTTAGVSLGYNFPTGGFAAAVTKDIIHDDLYGSANWGLGFTFLYKHQFKNNFAVGLNASLNYFHANAFKFSNYFYIIDGVDITGTYWVIPVVTSLEYHLARGKFDYFAGVEFGIVNTTCNYFVDHMYSRSGSPTRYLASRTGAIGGIVLGSSFQKSEKISYYISASYLMGTNNHAFNRYSEEFNSGFSATEFIAIHTGVLKKIK